MTALTVLHFLDRVRLIEHLLDSVQRLEAQRSQHLEDFGNAAWFDEVLRNFEALSMVAIDIRNSPDQCRLLQQLLSHLERIVLPLLLTMDRPPQDNGDLDSASSVSLSFATCCDLLMVTLNLCCAAQDDDVQSRLVDSILQFWPWSSVDNAVELLCRIFHFLSNSRVRLDPQTEKIVRENIYKCLELTCSERTCIRIAIELLPKFIDAFDGATTKSELASGIWNIIIGSFKSHTASDDDDRHDDDDDVTELRSNGIVLLASTADFLFEVDLAADHDWKSKVTFWKIIQHGLTSDDASRRKQSLYLLRRSLDCFSALKSSPCCTRFEWIPAESVRIRKCFGDLMFVLDTLEEKQMHIMKPLFPVVRRLVADSSKSAESSGGGSWRLHTSWIVVVLRRMLVHDSKTIRLWVIDEICSLDLTRIPILEQGMHTFLNRHFLMSFNETGLFTGIGKTSESGSQIGLKLGSHFRHCLTTLEFNRTQTDYFSRLLRNLHSARWSSVPLFYVAEALNSLPETSSPLWSVDSIGDLRELVVNTVHTHDTVIREATREVFLRAFLKLSNLFELTLNKIATVLSIFECLRRGTYLWDEVVQTIRLRGSAWLESAAGFVRDATANILTRLLDTNEFVPLNDTLEMLKIAKMTVLLIDAQNNESTFTFDLEPFVSVLKTAHSRPYMAVGKSEVSMTFLLTLNDVATPVRNQSDKQTADEVEFMVRAQICNCANEYMHYFKRRVFQDSCLLEDYDNLKVHFKFVQFLISNGDLRHIMKPHLIELACTCCTFLDEMDDGHNYLKKMSAASCLALVCRALDFNTTSEGFSIADLMNTLMTSDQLCSTPKPLEPMRFAERTLRINPNQMASEYVRCIWQCIFHFLSSSSASSSLTESATDTILKNGIEALQMGSADSQSIIFECFELILPTILKTNPAFVEHLFDSCWMALIENRPSVSFRRAVVAFTNMAFQKDIMSDEKMAECMCQYAKRFYEKSETYHGMYLPLMKKVTSVWKKESPIQIGHVPILSQGLVFGHVHRKDHRVVQDTEAYIASLGQSISANTLHKSDHLHDRLVRVESVIMLLSLSDNRVDIVSRLIDDLFERDAAITRSRPRHYANSLTHRTKQRIWQSLSILQPLYTEELAVRVLAKIVELLVSDNLQPSVRYLMEWLVVRICLRFTQFTRRLWTAMDTAGKTRVGSLGSFLSIVGHIGCAISPISTCEQFISKAISAAIPWISAQHFNTRIYAQVTLNRLWQCCRSNNFENLIQMYGPVETLFDVSADHGGTARSAVKMSTENYFQMFFDPEKHFSVETIYYELPRLTNVLEDEWLPARLFLEAEKALNDRTNGFRSIVPLVNGNRDLAELETGSWLGRCSGANDDEAVTDATGGGDMQRKLTPWKEKILASHKPVVRSTDDDARGSHLVVVASLIAKATNLGGLCRTCEVFGASCYVIGSLHHVEDNSFQSLSVSSQKWVPIKEVKVHKLKDYLMHMKTLGYTVVGIEQTTNNIQLNEYKFTEKTVLVLGKEKEGIPAEIIRLMDVCVEIPQQGMVRSLNVHVTGAIVMWEYRRQRSSLPSSQ